MGKAAGRDFDPVTAGGSGGRARRSCDSSQALSRSRHRRRGIRHRAPDARLKWIIDPIDGTRGFIMGTPMWGTLIGLAEDDEPVLGVMNQPYTGERFWSMAPHPFSKARRGERGGSRRAPASGSPTPS